jgi:two-component system cell cycle response regulator
MDIEPSSDQGDDKPVQQSTILIVDDSRVVRLTLGKLLGKTFRLQEATNGEEGWEKLLADQSIQVVFSDLSMPVLDGFGLLARIRSSETRRIRELPFIIITGNEDDENIRSKAIHCGATDLVVKPFDPLEIETRANAYATNQRQLNDAFAVIEEQTTVDRVTGLANQRYFMQRAKEELSFAIRHKREVALVSIQVDDFGKLTSQYGKHVGHDVLTTVGELLKSHTRTEDTVAHIGDGRFNVLMPSTNRVGAKHLSKRIASAAETSKIFCANARVPVKVSIGLAAPEIKPGLTLDHFVDLAEQRLSLAIAMGGNAIVDDHRQNVRPMDSVIARDGGESGALRSQAQQEARRRAEAQARSQTEQDARRRAEAQARSQTEQDARRQISAENSKLQALADSRRQAQEVLNRLKAALGTPQHPADAEHSRIQADQGAPEGALADAARRTREDVSLEAVIVARESTGAGPLPTESNLRAAPSSQTAVPTALSGEAGKTPGLLGSFVRLFAKLLRR